MNHLLKQVQNQLESLYGIGIRERVEEFIIGKDEALDLLQPPSEIKIPKELFLVRESQEDMVEVALFLDQKLIHNLEKNDPFESLNRENLSDFCILIEGISHFVYYLWKAHKEIPITQLEMELQAEIDKFLMLFFYLRSDNQNMSSESFFKALFEDFQLFAELSEQEKERYQTASDLACRYCYQLQQKYQNNQEITQMLEEIRAFYKWSQSAKIKHIMH